MKKQFQIINNGQEQQQKDPEERCCVFPDSSHTQTLPGAALCEMECEMSALNIPAVDYTHYLTPGFESIQPPALRICHQVTFTFTQVQIMFPARSRPSISAAVQDASQMIPS